MIYYNKFDLLIKDYPKIYLDAQDARQLFDKYLFHLIEIEDFILDSKSSNKHKRHNSIDEILKLDPEFVLEVKIITPRNKSKREGISDEEIEIILKHSDDELVLLRDYLDKLGFDNKIFTLDWVVKNHPNLTIDIIELKP